MLVYFSIHQELGFGAVSRGLANRNRSLEVFVREQKSPTLFVARLNPFTGRAPFSSLQSNGHCSAALAAHLKGMFSSIGHSMPRKAIWLHYRLLAIFPWPFEFLHPFNVAGRGGSSISVSGFAGPVPG